MDTCPNPHLGAVVMSVCGTVHVIFEYWLGKTKRVKANSTLELLLELVSLIFRRRKKDVQSDQAS